MKAKGDQGNTMHDDCCMHNALAGVDHSAGPSFKRCNQNWGVLKMVSFQWSGCFIFHKLPKCQTMWSWLVSFGSWDCILCQSWLPLSLFPGNLQWLKWKFPAFCIGLQAEAGATPPGEAIATDHHTLWPFACSRDPLTGLQMLYKVWSLKGKEYSQFGPHQSVLLPEGIYSAGIIPAV